MCFSAPVSFAASGILTAAGIGSMRKAKKEMRMVAAIPLIFAAQQFIEGLQWLAVTSGKPSQFLAYAFLFFAFLFWPVYIPVTVYLNEKSADRKKYLKYFIYTGTFISAYLLTSLYFYPLNVEVACCGLGYYVFFPFWWLIGPAYVLVLFGSLLSSTDKYFKIFSLLMLLSASLSWLIFKVAFTSVWCFFAAALSGLIYFYFYKTGKSKS